MLPSLTPASSPEEWTLLAESLLDRRPATRLELLAKRERFWAAGAPMDQALQGLSPEVVALARLRAHPAVPTKPRDLRRLPPCLIGDPALGSWPHDRPTRLSDEELTSWLPLLATGASDHRALRCCALAFRATPRTVWVPASRAIASFGSHDPKLLTVLSESISHGLTQRRQAQPAASARVLRWIPEGAHAPRHLTHLGACLLSQGCEVPAPVLETLLAAPAPKDHADFSARLLAIVELLSSDSWRARAGEVLRGLVNQRQEPFDDQAADALRVVADAVEATDGDTHTLIVAALTEARFHDARGADRSEAAWGWLETAQWLAAKRNTPWAEGVLQQMSKAAGPLTSALALRTGVGDPFAAVLHHLPRLTPAHAGTSAAEDTGDAVITLAVALESELLLDRPWKLFVERALGAAVAAGCEDGPVRKIARRDLVRRAVTSSRERWSFLLHEALLAEEDIFALAGDSTDYLASQLAVHTERLLRRTPPDQAARLLWRAFRAGAPRAYFVRLGRTLKGRSGCVAKLADAIVSLADIRTRPTEDRDARTLLDAWQAVAARIDALEGTPRDERGRACAFVDRMSDLAALGSSAQTPSPIELATAIRQALIGVREGDSACEKAWCSWLGDTPRDWRGASRHLVEVVDAVSRSPDVPPASRSDELDEALDRVATLVKGLSLPEQWSFDPALARLRTHAAAVRSNAERSERLCEPLVGWLERHDEIALTKWMGAEDSDLGLVPLALLHRMHAFLLDNLRFKEASKLANAARARVELPSVSSHVAPLFAGVASGSLLVLDIGLGGWEYLADGGHGPTLSAMVFVLLAAGFSLFVNDLSTRMSRSNHPTVWHRAWAASKRALPTYAMCVFVAFVCSLLIQSTTELGQTRFRENSRGAMMMISLWTAFAVFLGIFLGLVAQGRRSTRE